MVTVRVGMRHRRPKPPVVWVAGHQPHGTLTPAQTFDPLSFLDFLTDEAVTWNIETATPRR
ncbi:hypothetical protein D5S18_19095 [Nocardia panacis]|uniref:Uncharacterized protein n=1 Tax=Nocardia panacis TaxID=2340916 RepID=A0A3A4K4M5_9NOCA|nr:hypothetical protein D5S18_19095 [Nocardia panacis]